MNRIRKNKTVMFRSFVLENEFVFYRFYKSFIIILRRCESVLITEQNISFFRLETDNDNRQYEKDARDIIANAGVTMDENFKIHEGWVWWYEYCGYAQFYLCFCKSPDLSIYRKLVEIDMKHLGIDHTQHLLVAMKMFGRKMQHEEV